MISIVPNGRSTFEISLAKRGDERLILSSACLAASSPEWARRKKSVRRVGTNTQDMSKTTNIDNSAKHVLSKFTQTYLPATSAAASQGASNHSSQACGHGVCAESTPFAEGKAQ